MYEIKRDERRVVISDHEGRVIYSASPEAYVVYAEGKDNIIAVQVKSLPDAKLLEALARSVQLKLEPKTADSITR